MKLYIANGTYVGTQAEAKAINRDYSQVEVPTDKPGLISFLNQLHNERSDREDQFETVVARHDPPAEAVGVGAIYHEVTRDNPLQFDEAWEQFPLARKLHFAALACEEAREIIKPVSTQTYGTFGSQANVEHASDDAQDDELFG